MRTRHDDIGVLFDLAGIAQVGQDGNRGAALFGRLGELCDGDRRSTKLAGEILRLWEIWLTCCVCFSPEAWSVVAMGCT
jgi:hypothetical protein